MACGEGCVDEPCGELVEGQRPADAVALGDVASEDTEAVGDVVGLDALRHDLQAEVVTEVDRRSDDRLVLCVDDQVGDEAAVDLELGDRELAEVAQRRVSGTEVVDREVDADLM